MIEVDAEVEASEKTTTAGFLEFCVSSASSIAAESINAIWCLLNERTVLLFLIVLLLAV